MLTPRRYSPRHEVVTALQFDGTLANALDIIAALHLPGAGYFGNPEASACPTGRLVFLVNGCRLIADASEYIIQLSEGRFFILTAKAFYEQYARPIQHDAELIVNRAVTAATDSLGYVSAGNSGPAILATTLRRVLLEALEHEGE